MSRFLCIFALFALVWAAAPAGAEGPSNGGNPPPQSNLRPKDGSYNLTIAGFIRSNGSSAGSTVAGNKVTLRADVVSSESSESGKLSADLTLVDATHFKGKGTVLGQSAEFTGRLDFPDSVKERAIKGVRLVCTVKTSSGNYARIIGYVPALASVKDKSDDDEQDRGKNHDRGKPEHKK